MSDIKRVLVVGAGLAGVTIARTLAENKFDVDVIDKRDHVAGNIFDFVNSNNERIHKYGPHLLHCNKESKGLKFLSRFTDWIAYEHKVRALLSDNRTTPLPINKITLEDIFNKKFESEDDVKYFLDTIRKNNITPRNTDELFESTVGAKLADIFFRPYSKKMWGIDPKNLETSIGARLPVRTNNDTRYFNDNFQALPKEGYTKMIEKMLDHKNIKIYLNTSYSFGMEKDYAHSFLCIPIDVFFNFKYGELPYRSIIFEHTKDFGKDLEAPVINFTDNFKYTRKTQWNLLPNSYGNNYKFNTITFEKPCGMKENPGEFYYPVQTKKSKKIYDLYRKLSYKERKITFCGRTGLFRYIDMIPAVNMHLKIAIDFLKNKL